MYLILAHPYEEYAANETSLDWEQLESKDRMRYANQPH